MLSLKSIGMCIALALLSVWMLGLFGCSQGPPLTPEQREARVAEAAKIAEILADQGARAFVLIELPTKAGVLHETSFGNNGRIFVVAWNDPK